MLAVNFYVKDVAPHFVGFFWVGSSAKHQQHRFIGWYAFQAVCIVIFTLEYSLRYLGVGKTHPSRIKSLASGYLTICFLVVFWGRRGPAVTYQSTFIGLWEWWKIAPAPNALLPCGGLFWAKAVCALLLGVVVFFFLTGMILEISIDIVIQGLSWNSRFCPFLGTNTRIPFSTISELCFRFALIRVGK